MSPIDLGAGPSHHFEVTAKWPVAFGSGHLANSLCVFASRCLIDTKWYRTGAHQQRPSQLTGTVIYSITEQYLNRTPRQARTKSPKSSPSPLSSSYGFFLLPVHSLRVPPPHFRLLGEQRGVISASQLSSGEHACRAKWRGRMGSPRDGVGVKLHFPQSEQQDHSRFQPVTLRDNSRGVQLLARRDLRAPNVPARLQRNKERNLEGRVYAK